MEGKLQVGNHQIGGSFGFLFVLEGKLQVGNHQIGGSFGLLFVLEGKFLVGDHQIGGSFGLLFVLEGKFLVGDHQRIFHLLEFCDVTPQAHDTDDLSAFITQGRNNCVVITCLCTFLYYPFIAFYFPCQGALICFKTDATIWVLFSKDLPSSSPQKILRGALHLLDPVSKNAAIALFVIQGEDDIIR